MISSQGYTWLMDGLQTLGMIVLGWYGWVMKKEMADAQVLRELQTELANAKQTIALLEQRIFNSPTHQDLGDLHERINDLSGAVRELVGVMSGVQRSLDRVETKLINEGSR
ncbi:hypothetical protein A9404_00355 [Halothiobacillus diazotrophicus]|uniref:DUF2730 domain-containing protein n=1 Tax=Halothiobacillus diazotrophicus TaxID=1860122 RepID=A0A191ZDU2_9GAMM|nr:hypothetical protein [Halothiobacillus diazotrophicus]ANJ66035.1 hypothetical protein A9404_00355 [Halothiobacillus diazotrophicus]